MTQRDIAGYLDVDRTTLYNWKKKKPNLYKTLMLGLKSKEVIESIQQKVDELRILEEFEEVKQKKIK